MAPFYTTLAIWIGGVVLAALIKATPSARALQERLIGQKVCMGFLYHCR